MTHWSSSFRVKRTLLLVTSCVWLSLNLFNCLLPTKKLASKVTIASFSIVNNMDTAFFDDGRSYVSSSNNKEEVRKRLTLDLNSPRLKKPRFDVLLSSPDLNMLKLPSPELEKLIMQQNGLLSATPTPGGFVYPTPTSTGTNNSSSSSNNNNPRAVTRDQEMYVRGFDDALAELHQQAGAQQQQQQAQILSGGQHSQQQNHHSLLETGSSIAATPFGVAAARPPTSSSPYPNNTSMQVYNHTNTRRYFPSLFRGNNNTRLLWRRNGFLFTFWAFGQGLMQLESITPVERWNSR